MRLSTILSWALLPIVLSTVARPPDEDEDEDRGSDDDDDDGFSSAVPSITSSASTSTSSSAASNELTGQTGDSQCSGVCLHLLYILLRTSGYHFLTTPCRITGHVCVCCGQWWNSIVCLAEQGLEFAWLDGHVCIPMSINGSHPFTLFQGLWIANGQLTDGDNVGQFGWVGYALAANRFRSRRALT